MIEKRRMSAFQTEAADTRWCFANQDVRDEEFAQAIVDDRTSTNTLPACLAASKRVAAENTGTPKPTS